MKRFISVILVVALVLSMCTVFSMATSPNTMNILFSDDLSLVAGTGVSYIEKFGGKLYLSDNIGGTVSPSITENIRKIATPRRNASNNVNYNTAGTPDCDWNDQTYVYQRPDGEVVLKYTAPFWIDTDYDNYTEGDVVGGSVLVEEVAPGSFNGVVIGSYNSFGNNASFINSVATSGYGYTFTDARSVVRVFVYNSDGSMTYYDVDTGVNLADSFNDVAIYIKTNGGVVTFNNKVIATIEIAGTNAAIKDIEGTVKASTDKAYADYGANLSVLFQAAGTSTIYYKTMRIANGTAPTEVYNLDLLDCIDVAVGVDMTINVTAVEYPLVRSLDESYTVKFSSEKYGDVIAEADEGGIYSFKGIELEDMNEAIDIILMNGEDVVDIVEDWSIREYLVDWLQEDADYGVLAANIARLGSELNKYQGGEGWEDGIKVTAIAESRDAFNPDPISVDNGEEDYFTSAQLLIDDNFNLRFNFVAKNAVALVITDGMTPVVITNLSKGYVLSDDLAVGLLTSQYTATLYDADEQALASVTYSAANYIYNKFGVASEQQGIVKALSALLPVNN